MTTTTTDQTTCEREGCAATFAQPSGGRRKRYCTKACGYRANNDQRRAARPERAPVPCSVCGTTYMPNGTAKTCSPACRAERAGEMQRRRNAVAYWRDPEASKAKATAWQVANREAANANARASRQRVRQRDPLTVKARESDKTGARRVRAAGGDARTVGAEALVSLWGAQDGACLACLMPLDLDARQGAPGFPELAHLVPIAAGGGHSLDNLGWLDSPCNEAQRDAAGLDAVRRIGAAAIRRGRGVPALHAAMTRAA